MGQIYDQATGLILPTRGGGGGGGGGGPVDLTKNFDDFDVWSRAGVATGYGKFGWVEMLSGTGASIGSRNIADSRAVFVNSLCPGTVNTGRVMTIAGRGNVTPGNIFFDDLGAWNYYWFSGLSEVPDGTDGHIFVDGGFSDAWNGSSVGTNYVMARAQTQYNPNWYFEVKKASALAITTVITSIPVVTAITSFRLRVFNNGGTKTAELYINSVLAGTITTNIPDTSANVMGLFHKIQNNGATTTTRYLDLVSHVRLTADYPAGRFL